MPFGDKLRKFIVAIVAAVVAGGSGLVLTQISRAPDRAAVAADEATPTVGEGRNLTREVLRSRREHSEALAEVRPDPSLGARQPVASKDTAVKEAAAKEAAAKEATAKEAKEHPAAKDAPKPKPASVALANAPAMAVLPRIRPDGTAEPAAHDAVANIPVVNAPVANAPAANIPGASIPVAGDPPPQPEPPRSIGSMVFSTVSDLSGKAANLTGDTANFVIDLPGKLIAAGGRLFERPQPPPPKREAL